MSYLHSDDAFDYPAQHPQLPEAESNDPEGFAQADLLHFDGIVDPADDKLIKRDDVVTLFVVAFGYRRSTFKQLNHAKLVTHPFYEATYAYRIYEERQPEACTRYLKSRIIALIRAIKRSAATGDEVAYPHERAEGQARSSQRPRSPSDIYAIEEASVEEMENDALR